MKLCSLFKKKSPCKVELQMAESRRQLNETNKQIDSMKATLDGEIDWFLVVESREAREREKSLTHAVEEICSVT
jgi:hypothetical protein